MKIVRPGGSGIDIPLHYVDPNSVAAINIYICLALGLICERSTLLTYLVGILGIFAELL